MKKLTSKFALILFAIFLLVGINSAQTLAPGIDPPSWQTQDGYNAVYQIAMTDSVGTTYSPGFNLHGYLPQDLTTYPIVCYVVGTGTKDSVKVIVQTRMKKTVSSTGATTWSTWKVSDTVIVNFNKVDGYAYQYSINFNGGRPDQMRFQIIGASSVNRKDVVITAIAVLTKQYGIFTVR